MSLQTAFESILGTGVLVFVSLLVMLGFAEQLIRRIVSEKFSPWPLLAILLVGMGLRLWWICTMQPTPESDFALYWDYAQRFAHGDLSFTPLDRHAGTILFYTYAFKLFGTSLAVGWGVNLFFSLLLLLVTYRLTCELFGRRAALIATTLAALLPQIVTYSALMATEIPAIVFTLLIVWAVINAPRERLAWPQPLLYWLALGVLIYGAVMVRATNLLLLPAFVLVFLFSRRDCLKPALSGLTVMAVTAALLIATWVYHQYLLTGVPKLFFTEYWLAYATRYDHGGSTFPMERLPYYAQLQTVQDGTVAGDLRARKLVERESLKILMQDPLRYVLFGFTRIQNSLWYARTGVVWSVAASPVFTPGPKFVRRLSEISTISWRVLLCLSALGLWPLIALLRGQKTSAEATSSIALEGQLVIWTFLAIWLTLHFLMAVATDRYTLQIAPFSVILAAGGLSMLSEQLSTRFRAAKHPPQPPPEAADPSPVTAVPD